MKYTFNIHNIQNCKRVSISKNHVSVISNRIKFKSGFGIIEVLVTVVIISLIIVGLYSASVRALQLIQHSTQRSQATFLAEETIEVLRSLRDAGWSSSFGTLTSGTDYYLALSGGVWTITTTNIFIDKTFERTFAIEDANRDGSYDIASTGTPDDDTKKIIVSVSWHNQMGTTTQNIETYLTNMFQN
jgi:prepilin-type N-terminal cleavage/methylation domain-containing protein